MTEPLNIESIRDAMASHEPDTRASENATRNAAVAMIIANHEELDLAALFIQRAEHPGDPWSGQMAMPGGRNEDSDASYQHAAMRETLEEVGVTLTDEMCIGRLHDLYGGRLEAHRMAVSPYVFDVGPVPKVTLNYEVADTVWVPLEFMRYPENTTPYVFHLDPEGREFPAFRYESYTIWGLTFRILANFYRTLGIEHPADPIATDVE
ncbi:MAG: CoA pyrophosphatase [Candidatus Hydrogenedentota bacterium]